MNKYIIVILALFVYSPCFLRAQSKSEFTVSLGAGSSALKYQSDKSQSKSGTGGLFGIGYSSYFNRMIGISFGLEAGMFTGSIAPGNLSDEQQIPAPTGLSGNFLLRANYEGLKEKQTAVMLQIPVMLQLRFPLDVKNSFFLGAGIKAGFPVSAKWNQNADKLTTTGYSEYTNQQYVDMPNHGFSTYSGISASGKLELKSPVLLALEGGLKFGIGEGKYLYAGIYLDYGLNDIYKSSAKTALLDYNTASPPDYSYHSILTTNRYSASEGIKPFAVGIKIKMGIGSGKVNNPVDKKEKSVKRTDNSVNKTDNSVNRTDNPVNKPDKSVNRTDKSVNKPDKSVNKPVNKPVKEPVKKAEPPKPKRTEQKSTKVGD